jgi:hypothetical protein
MYLLFLAAYIVVAVCVWVVLNRKQYLVAAIPNWAYTVSLAICWPVHLWSWFGEFRKELF